jgi:hypothetical protein
MRTRFGPRQQSRFLVIALAALGLALPPWSVIGPASRASAIQSRLLCRAIPGQVLTALSSAVAWASGHRVASWASPVAHTGAEPLDGLRDVDPNLADRDGGQDDASNDVDDLANPVVAQAARPGHFTPSRAERGALESWTGRSARSQTALVAVRLRVQESSPDDLPTSLCRLTC